MYASNLILTEEIKRLSNVLELQYSEVLNFKNHCFLRIAYDNTVSNKWNLVVKSPFIKYADLNQLETVLKLLKTYTFDKQQLLIDNINSLKYREQTFYKTNIESNGLF